MSGGPSHQFRTLVDGHEVWLTHERDSQNRDVPGAIYAMSRNRPLDRVATITIADITGVRAEQSAIAEGIDWFDLSYEEMNELARTFAEREGRMYEVNAFETVSGSEAEAIDLFAALIGMTSPDELFRRPGFGATDTPIQHAEYQFAPHNVDRSLYRVLTWHDR